MVRNKLQISLALLYGILISAASEHVVYPAGGGNCPTPPCLTLDDYLSNASHYFTNHSSFLFLPGQHSLNTTLRLENLENVTLRATEAGAIITVSPEGGVMCYRMNDFTISSLEIWCRGDETLLDDYIVLYFKKSVTLSILNTCFLGISNASTALYWTRSTGRVANCSFSSFIGSAIIARSSKISFNHVNYFINNSATDLGGAVYSRNSKLDFSGHVSFIGNTAPEGGAVYSGELDFSGNVCILKGEIQNLTFQGTFSGHCIQNLTFIGNTAPEGGAVYSVDSELDFSGHVSFTGNTAPEKGAVCSEGSELEFSGHVSFIGNTADLKGEH